MEIIMKKMLFVFNPNSGKAQIKNSLLKIIQIFSNADYEVTVYPTKAVPGAMPPSGSPTSGS